MLVTRRLAVLDGLRGIAILQVFICHIVESTGAPRSPIIPWLFTGYTGVELFFFISGFVIAWPFIKAQHEGSTPPTWKHFYTRRLLKIMPSYLLVIAVMYAVNYSQSLWPHHTTIAADLFSHLTFIHNWFPALHDSIDGPLWTLGVEINFYLVFPLVWMAFSRLPWATLAISVAASYIWKAWLFSNLSDHNAAQSYAATLFGFIDLFVIGMAAAYAYLKLGSISRLWSELLAGVALVSWAVALWRLYRDTLPPSPIDQNVWMVGHQWWLGLSYATLALACLLGAKSVTRLIANPVLVWFGFISYNLYLWNHFIISEAAYHWVELSMTSLIVVIVGILAISAAITVGLEQPILRWVRTRA